MSALSRWGLWTVVTLSMTLGTAAWVGAPAAEASGAAFSPAYPTVYISQAGSGTSTDLKMAAQSRLANAGAGGATISTVGTAATKYNAVGYRSADGYLYGMADARLTQVASDGSLTDLGAVSGLPAGSYISGSFGAGASADTLFVMTGSASAIYGVDVASRSVTSTLPLSEPVSVAGFTFAHRSLWGMNTAGGAVRLARIAMDGTVTNISAATVDSGLTVLRTSTVTIVGNENDPTTDDDGPTLTFRPAPHDRTSTGSGTDAQSTTVTKPADAEVYLLDGTDRVTACSVAAFARVEGRRVRVGSGRTVLHATAGRARMAVTVQLTRLGRGLADRVGGVRLALTGEVRQARVSGRSYAAAATRVQAPSVRLRPVYFDTDSATVRPGDRRYLRRVRHLLTGVKAVLCRGYTDSRSTVTYNADLGRRRARATCAVLVGTGASGKGRGHHHLARRDPARPHERHSARPGPQPACRGRAAVLTRTRPARLLSPGTA